MTKDTQNRPRTTVDDLKHIIDDNARAEEEFLKQKAAAQASARQMMMHIIQCNQEDIKKLQNDLRNCDEAHQSLQSQCTQLRSSQDASSRQIDVLTKIITQAGDSLAQAHSLVNASVEKIADGDNVTAAKDIQKAKQVINQFSTEAVVNRLNSLEERVEKLESLDKQHAADTKNPKHETKAPKGNGRASEPDSSDTASKSVRETEQREHDSSINNSTSTKRSGEELSDSKAFDYVPTLSKLIGFAVGFFFAMPTLGSFVATHLPAFGAFSGVVASLIIGVIGWMIFGIIGEWVRKYFYDRRETIEKTVNY